MPALQEILDRMETLAYGVSGDASISPLIDSEVTAYTLFPHLAKFVVSERAKKGIGLEDLMTSHSIAIVDGVGTLPDSVIKDAMKHAYIPASSFASLVSYPDYTRFRYDNQLCYFAVKGSSIYYSCTAGTQASGTWTFASNPVHNETIVVNGVTFTFKQPNMLVAGAGNPALNGTHTYRSSTPVIQYNLLGQPDDLFLYAITSVGASSPYTWQLWNHDGSGVGYSGTSAASPALSTWSVNGLFGTAPAPTVSKVTVSSAVEIEIGTTVAETIANFVSKLNDSVNAAISVATYAAASSTTATGTYDAGGTAGNAFTMANSSAGAVTRSAATFTGGVDLVLRAPTVPALPATITSAVDMSQSLIEDIIVTGVAVLRGEIPLARIIEGYMPPTKE